MDEPKGPFDVKRNHLITESDHRRNWTTEDHILNFQNITTINVVPSGRLELQRQWADLYSCKLPQAAASKYFSQVCLCFVLYKHNSLD